MLKQEILQLKYNVSEELRPFIFLWTYHLLGLDDVFLIFAEIDSEELLPSWSLPGTYNFRIFYYILPSVISFASIMLFSVFLSVLFLIILYVVFFFFFTITIHFAYIFIYLCIRRLRSCSWMVISDKIALLCICRFSSSSSFYFSLVWVLLPSHFILGDPYAVFHCWLSTFLPWITQYSQ